MYLKKNAMELYPINVARLAMLESGQFINRFMKDFENSGVNSDEDPLIQSEIADLKLQMLTYGNALMQIKAREESAALQLLDINRRRRFSVVKRAHSVYEYDEEVIVSEAYRGIKVILTNYKNLPFENYEAESLGIEKCIADLRNAKNNATETLLMRPVIDALEVANEAFKRVFSNRSSKNISSKKYDTKALRTAIFETYRNLATYTFLMAKRKKTPFYETTLKALNNGRAYYADILAHRKGVKNKKDLKQEKVEIVADLDENLEEN
jgi:hypothetical protein